MSKLSFRARALDATKAMPVFKAQDIPDLPEFTAINRAVQQMPTGMEKEEETEHHLQRALSAQQAFGTAEALVIPVPDIVDVGDRYQRLYIAKQDYKPPKQYVHVQPWGVDQEIPDYDLDSEDEQWLTKQAKKMEVTPLKFENMMDRLEKGSGQTVVTLPEAKALLKEDDDLTISVYDYWLNKRLRLQHALIPTVKTEKRDGSTTNNPYVAFRRRTEKMQTRKNRKNDEVSYEKMLKLRRDLNRALTILEMMKRREKSKKELLQLTIEIVEKRYQMQDWDSKALAEAMALRHKLPAFVPLTNNYGNNWAHRDGTFLRKPKREYKKRKHKTPIHSTTSPAGYATAATPASAQTTAPSGGSLSHYTNMNVIRGADGFSSDEEIRSLQPSASEADVDEEPDDPDGVYAFRRKAGCHYHAPIEAGLTGWPWCGRSVGGLAEKRYRYCLASLNGPSASRRPRCVAFVRRRVGRGGRVLLDRAHTDWDDYLTELDFNTAKPLPGFESEYISYVKQNDLLHFRAHVPPHESGDSSSDDDGHHRTHRRPTAVTMPMIDIYHTPQPQPSRSSEFSFETHREALLAMQREQRAALLRNSVGESHHVSSVTPESSSSSRVTLDSARAQFAASALCTQLTTTHHVVTPSSGGGQKLTNGPTTSDAAAAAAAIRAVSSSSGLSTSPAANVLQLNFPLSTPPPSMTTTAPLLNSSLTSASMRHALFPSVAKMNTSSSSSSSIVLKLPLAVNKTDTLAVDTTEVNNIVAENSQPMEVT